MPSPGGEQGRKGQAGCNAVGEALAPAPEQLRPRLPQHTDPVPSSFTHCPWVEFQQAHRDGSCVFCLSALAPARCLDSLQVTIISVLAQADRAQKVWGRAWEAWPVHQ